MVSIGFNMFKSKHRKKSIHLAACVFAVALLLASCNQSLNNASNNPVSEPAKELNFDVQYTATNAKGNYSEFQRPKAVLIDTRQQLDEYYQNNKDRFDLETLSFARGCDGFVSFDEAIRKYDSGWFDSKQLLLVIHSASTTVTTYEVVKVIGHPDNSVIIHIKKPGFGELFQTAHILIELSKEFSEDDLLDVRIYHPVFLEKMKSAKVYADKSGKIVLRLSEMSYDLASYELSGDIGYIYSILSSDVWLWGSVRRLDLSADTFITCSMDDNFYIQTGHDQVKLSKSQDFTEAIVLQAQ